MLVDLSNTEEGTCTCVGKHVPLPKILYKLTISLKDHYVCPTTYHNILSLLDEYDSHNGRPPGFIRKHYSEYVQNLVENARSRV